MRNFKLRPLAIVCHLTLLACSLRAEPAPVAGAAGGQPRRMTLATGMEPRELQALSMLRVGGAQVASGVVPEGPALYLVHNIEFTDAAACNALDVENVFVFNRFDRFADVFVLYENKEKCAQRLAAVRASNGYVWDEFAGAANAPPTRIGQVTASRATPEPIVRGGLNGLTGKGVIIVVIDTGIDFRNPDFVTYDDAGKPSSRLRYFWDTSSESWAAGEIGKPTPVTFPNGTSIGRLYSHDDLNNDLRSAETLIPVWDVDGHGTSCAGVSAGNGNNSKGRYKGVAPEAEIIGVRLGDSLEHGYLLNSICEWVDKVAGDTPVVFTCSFGGKFHGHDGMRVEDRQLSSRFPLTRSGRAICIAAGNDGGSTEHAEISFVDEQHAGLLRWKLPAGGFLSVFYSTADPTDMRFVPAGNLDLKETGSVNPLTGQYVSNFEAPEGKGELRLYSVSGKTITADAYLFSNAGGGFGFDPVCVTASKLIQSPGTALNAITVGSYDWNDQFEQHGKLSAFTDPVNDQPLTIGALSTYSSVGPLRNNDAVKPDVVSPGQYYAASASRNTRATRDTTLRYELFNGTSAATPYTAGVVALIMQRKPTITLGEIKELLKTSATQDRFTGRVPNPKWGYGKLDLAAVKKALGKLE